MFLWSAVVIIVCNCFYCNQRPRIIANRPVGCAESCLYLLLPTLSPVLRVSCVFNIFNSKSGFHYMKICLYPISILSMECRYMYYQGRGWHVLICSINTTLYIGITLLLTRRFKWKSLILYILPAAFVSFQIFVMYEIHCNSQII